MFFMYHMIWVHLNKGRVWEGYVTHNEAEQLAARNVVQIIYKREISVPNNTK